MTTQFNLGDWVIVHFKDSLMTYDGWVHPPSLTYILNEHLYKSVFKTRYYKGRIVKIETHHLFGLIKRKQPIYWVQTIGGSDFIQIKTHKPKHLIRGKKHETMASS
jgi:hypothetical protein